MRGHQVILGGARGSTAILISLLGLLLAGLVGLSASAAYGADKDCGDFATQKGAQDFYIANGGPESDPHGLDSDDDGVACESNPCPCSDAQGGGDGGGTDPEPTPEPEKSITQFGKVVKVIDGDTVDVKLKSGNEERVRIIGIDTPEVYGGEECFGPEASSNAKDVFREGTRVTLHSDPTQDLEDAYDRLLRYVTRNKGKKDWGKVQLKGGYATVYLYDGNPFERVEDYRKDEKKAKKDKAGLWGAC